MSEKNIQLTEGSIWKGLLQFAFPLFLGNLFAWFCFKRVWLKAKIQSIEV